MESIKKNKILSTIVLVKGILTVLLGIIHIIMSYFEYNLIKDEMPKYIGYKYILWYYAVGLFILFIGLIDIISYKGIKQKINLAWQISLLNSIFSLVLGLSGLITFKWALSPPYFLFAIGIICLIPLLLFKKEFNNK
jgi:heme/copper-type cytochrome/quinol oxidase subunit 3